jgi:hypothetical protein
LEQNAELRISSIGYSNPDVKPFLARPAEAQLLENNTVQTTLRQRRLNPNLARPLEL